MTKVFDSVLNAIVTNRIMMTAHKFDFKVHVKGTNVTMKHYGVPTVVLTPLVLKDIMTILGLIKRGIVGGKRRIIFEFP